MSSLENQIIYKHVIYKTIYKQIMYKMDKAQNNIKITCRGGYSNTQRCWR